MDLNKVANQLASGMAEHQLAVDQGSSSLPPATSREAGPHRVEFPSGPIRLGSVLDHTLLNPAATAEEIDRHCDEALRYGVAAACVNPLWVSRCAERLRGSGVAVASVIGFPFGTLPPELKAAEASLAVKHGATELDMVIPLGLVRASDYRALHADVAAVVAAAGDALVKVILETAALTPMEVLRAATVVGDAGAHYVKTSTGYSASGGATPEAVALLRLAVGDDLGVKASGGIRDARTAFLMLASGATRIGSSRADAMADATGPGPRRLHDLMHVPFQAGEPGSDPAGGVPAVQGHGPDARVVGEGVHLPAPSIPPPPAPQPPSPGSDRPAPSPGRVAPGWGTWPPR